MPMVKCMCGAVLVGGRDHPDPDYFFPSGNIHGTRGCWNKNPKAAITGSRTCGIYAPHDLCVVDLDKLRHQIKVDLDRCDSQIHAEREPWHAGIDPDDP